MVTVSSCLFRPSGLRSVVITDSVSVCFSVDFVRRFPLSGGRAKTSPSWSFLPSFGSFDSIGGFHTPCSASGSVVGVRAMSAARASNGGDTCCLFGVCALLLTELSLPPGELLLVLALDPSDLLFRRDPWEFLLVDLSLDPDRRLSSLPLDGDLVLPLAPSPPVFGGGVLWMCRHWSPQVHLPCAKLLHSCPDECGTGYCHPGILPPWGCPRPPFRPPRAPPRLPPLL